MDDLRELFELPAALSAPLPEQGLPARTVIAELTAPVDVERRLASFRELAPA
jgi:hypothetical protein